MRTLFTIITLAVAISACSLYLDDKNTPHISPSPDAYPFYPDAHVIPNDGGSGCHGSNEYPDGGIPGVDAGTYEYPDAGGYPDAGTYGYPDANFPDAH